VNTQIEFLRQLEADLDDAATREQGRLRREGDAAPFGGRSRRRPGATWAKVAGVAAAFLVVAGAIGFVANGGGIVSGFADGAGSTPAGQADLQRVRGGDASEGFAAPGAPEPTGGSPYSSENDVGGRSLVNLRRQQNLSKIVRDARIGVVVADGAFGGAVGDLTFIAERHGGFVLSSETQHERSGTFVLRIPARRFDAAIADVRELGGVRFQVIQGDDVTAEYVDLQARLRILLARRTLLVDLQNDATTTDEILRIASLIDDVQLRIEQIQGRIRFINDQVAEATLRVSIQERSAPAVTGEPEVDKPNLGSSLDLAVQGSLRIVGAVIVGLGYLIPLTILGLLVWGSIRLVRRRAAAL
jgi:hypothetical protein